MLDWLVIIGLIVFGLALIIIEVIFIPGVTFIGILGLLLAGFGVFLSFQNFGSAVGSGVLGVTAVVAVLAVVYSFRSGVWKKFALKTSIKSKFNEEFKHTLQKGAEGITVSALRPFGTAEFNEKLYEVRTNGHYLTPGTKVKIIKIQDNRIIVEPN